MRTTLQLLLAATMIVVWSSPCFALQENEEVLRERAKQLGVSLQSHPNGSAGNKVRIEFPDQGELKGFIRVELEIAEGDKSLVSAPLQTERPTPEKVTAYFSADPSHMDEAVLTIVVQHSPRTRVGYQFKIKDHLVPSKPD